MESLVGIVFLVAVAYYGLFTHISELHAKVNILLSNNPPNWEAYFTDEIRRRLNERKTAKAAMLLRQETGLSLKYCLAIIEDHLASASTA